MKLKTLAGAAATVFMMGGAMAETENNDLASTLSFEKDNGTLSMTATFNACTQDGHLAALTIESNNTPYTETADNKLTDQELQIVETSYAENLGPVFDSALTAFTSQISTDLVSKFETPDALGAEDFTNHIMMTASFLDQNETTQMQMGMMSLMAVLQSHGETALNEKQKQFETDMLEAFDGHIDMSADISNISMPSQQDIPADNVKFNLSVTDKPAPQCAPKM